MKWKEICEMFEKEETDCARFLLDSIDAEPIIIGRAIFEKTIRGAFQGGLNAALCNPKKLAMIKDALVEDLERERSVKNREERSAAERAIDLAMERAERKQEIENDDKAGHR